LTSSQSSRRYFVCCRRSALTLTPVWTFSASVARYWLSSPWSRGIRGTAWCLPFSGCSIYLSFRFPVSFFTKKNCTKIPDQSLWFSIFHFVLMICSFRRNQIYVVVFCNVVHFKGGEFIIAHIHFA